MKLTNTIIEAFKNPYMEVLYEYDDNNIPSKVIGLEVEASFGEFTISMIDNGVEFLIESNSGTTPQDMMYATQRFHELLDQANYDLPSLINYRTEQADEKQAHQRSVTHNLPTL